MVPRPRTGVPSRAKVEFFQRFQVRAMPNHVLQISDNFWNIRGSFKVLGFLDVGTQASLVRRKSGAFILLDSYTLRDDVRRQVMDLTGNGEAIEAIINLHPFHTVHCEQMHRDFPRARLYGTRRHYERFPGLPWESQLTEDSELHALFSEDLQFSVPRGVDFISSNENLHFSSVLAYHPASSTIHVDDTLMYLEPSGLLGLIMTKGVSFHPTLARVLEKRPGAVDDFRAWVSEIIAGWGDARNLCAAHMRVLTADKLAGQPMSVRLEQALRRVSARLDAHKKKYG
jgi:hypothetical protein